MVTVKNPTGRVIGGLVDNIRYDFKPGETKFDGPLAQYKRAVGVLNTENGTKLEVS